MDGVQQITHEVWYDYAAVHVNEVVVVEPGELAEKDNRAGHVQWMFDHAGQLVPFNAAWTNPLCVWPTSPL